MDFVLMADDCWYCYRDEELKGLIRRCQDGWWRFQPQPYVMLAHKDCRKLAEKLSNLNEKEVE